MRQSAVDTFCLPFSRFFCSTTHTRVPERALERMEMFILLSPLQVKGTLGGNGIALEAHRKKDKNATEN